MISFLDNNTDGNHSFLLYGRLDDWFCPDAQLWEFNNLLVKLLNSRGYQYVVFYGAAGNRGKYCRDETSRAYFFDSPAAQPSVPGEAPSGFITPPRSHRRRRADPQPSDEAAPAPDRPEPAQPAADPAPAAAQRIGQVNIANAEFIREISLRANRGEKFVVVFYNIFDFIEGGDESNRQLLDLLVSSIDLPSSRALCIFEAPADPDRDILCEALDRSPLRVKFLRREGGRPILNRFNCFHIGEPGLDEVGNLLRRLTKPDSDNGRECVLDLKHSRLTELSAALLHEAEVSSSDEPSIRRIQIQMERWMAEQNQSVIPFHDAWTASQVFGRALSDKELAEAQKPAIEKLNRPGWEKAYSAFQEILSLKRKQADKYRETQKQTEQNYDDICVKRLEGLRTIVGEKNRVPIPNFVLTGNPGTGKSEIGRMLSEILYEEKLLPTSRLVQVGKAELTSSLVAGIPRAVMECADRAEGGVLLIDEAPQIADEDGGLNNEGSGPEVVQTLNRIMTDPTRHLCVVLTGYPEGMEKLFAIDPGFRSRFGGNEIHIDDYKPPLLATILCSMLRNQSGFSFRMDPALYDPHSDRGDDQPLVHYMEHVYLKRDRRTFGNARAMATLASTLAGKANRNDRDVIRQEDFFGPAPFSENTDGDAVPVVDETWFEPVNPTTSMEALEQEILENYVGLEFLVERFRNIYARTMEALAAGKSVDKLHQRSFALVGHPGTGKDLVANLLGKLFRTLNILNCPEIITRDGNDLAKSIQGGSVQEAKEWVKEAQERNALLFINEAHQLCSNSFDGKGALRTFIAPMTGKKQFISAFAVYPEELENFYQLDNGLESRLEVIRLPEYTDRQLYEIFQRMARKKGRDVSRVLPTISRICVRLYRRRQPNSGNARQMETLLTEMDDRRIRRCTEQNIPYDDPERFVFREEDIPPAELFDLPDRGCEDERKSDFSEIERKLREEVIGREELVERFRALADSVLEARALDRNAFWPRPIVLAGNPGTGKTLIGRLLAELYHILGVVRSPDANTFDASAIASIYQNGMRRAAEDAVADARERHAMLFVDEAHQLLDSFDGRGAIQALISPMNDPDPEQRVLVVFAVYENRLTDFLAADIGMKRRVQVIHLSDYTGPELNRILHFMAAKDETPFSPELEAALPALCENLAARPQLTEGNAGMMERLLEMMNERRRERQRREGVAVANSPAYLTLTPEDIPPEYL